jgi:hypothetical protein
MHLFVAGHGKIDLSLDFWSRFVDELPAETRRSDAASPPPEHDAGPG